MSNGKPVKRARKTIEDRVKLSEAMLDKYGIGREQFERVALNALITNPAIANCDTGSLDKAIMRCAEMGLLPDGNMAAIVPHKNQAVLIPMIHGRIALARRATPGLVIRSQCVYAADEFVHEEGSSPRLIHEPNAKAARDADHIIAVYATALGPKQPQPEWEVLYRDDIDRYKTKSAAGERGPWGSDYGEMAEKTVLGLLLKRLPRRPVDQYSDFEAGVAEAEGGGFDLEPPSQSLLAGEDLEVGDPVNLNRETGQAERLPQSEPEPQPQPEPEPQPEPQAGTDLARRTRPANETEGPF